MMTILSAIILGGLFGFVLQRVGAGDPDKIINMLQLKDLHLMKVILLAIGISSLLLFSGMTIGIIDSAHLSVKGMYWGVIMGGLLLGVGWAIAGYCPGTGVVAAGTGRKDALFFIAGGLLGAGIFTLTYEKIQNSWLFESLLGGKVTLAQTGEYIALLEVNGMMIAGLIAIVCMIVAALLPVKIRD